MATIRLRPYGLDPIEWSMLCFSSILTLIVFSLVDWKPKELLDSGSTLLGLLLAGIVASIVYGFKPRVDRYREKFQRTKQFDDDRHQEKLENIFRRMQWLRLNIFFDDKIILEVPDNPTNNEKPKSLDDVRFLNFFRSSMPSEGYRLYHILDEKDVFENHLACADYKEAYLALSELKLDIFQYNLIHDAIRELVKKNLTSKLKSVFPDLIVFETILEPNAKYYFLQTLIYLITDEFYTGSRRFNENYPFHEVEYEADSHKRWKLAFDTKDRFDLLHTIIDLPEKDETCALKLQNIFNSIKNMPEIQTWANKIYEHKRNYLKNFEIFTKEMKKIVVNIDSGQYIKGSCEICS